MFRKAFATAGWRIPATGAAGRSAPAERARTSLAGIHLSIRTKILLALAIVMLATIILISRIYLAVFQKEEVR